MVLPIPVDKPAKRVSAKARRMCCVSNAARFVGCYLPCRAFSSDSR
jgi:hypothetical protein